jgi:Secretion system C-terminal sorting domain
MRKFLLILLNVLCLAGVNAQTRNLVSTIISNKSEYTGLKDTTYASKFFYDKKTCIDTLLRSVSISGNRMTIKNRKVKYNNLGQPIEVTWRDSIYTRPNTDGLFTYQSYVDRKSLYIFTPANVRADTMYSESFDTTSQKWFRTAVDYFRKPGIGNDTVKTTSKMEVYDANARIILEVGKLSYGSADSVRTTYENNKKIRVEQYVKSRLSWVTKYVYDGNNLVLQQELSYYIDYGTPGIDTLNHSYTYKNGQLDTEEYEEKRYTYPAAGKRFNSTYNKYFRKYNYDIPSKTSGYVETICDYWLDSKPCVKNEVYNLVYTKDSLKSVSKRTTYAYDTLALASYYYEQNFENCSPTISDVNELNQGIDFTLAPNPTTGTFNLSLSEEAVQSSAKVSVYNIQGSEVYNSKITSTSTAVDISNLSKGFYLVKVADKTHFTVKKLVLN